MALTPGTWVDLGDGRVAAVSSWDEASGQAEARTANGSIIERPVAFASVRWVPVSESGLRVAVALGADGIERQAQQTPTDIVVLALNDLGGRAETKELRDLISPLVISSQDWEQWWRRTQVRLESEPRIDASKSRGKIYSLASGRSALGASLIPPLRDERRRGRLMADGPQLKRARDRAQSKSALDEDDGRLFEAELSIASNPEVDPTDRFMTLELGIWLGRWTVDEARDLLGEDALSVDLLRIPQHASRQLALDWALSHAQAQGTQPANAIAFRSTSSIGIQQLHPRLGSMCQ